MAVVQLRIDRKRALNAPRKALEAQCVAIMREVEKRGLQLSGPYRDPQTGEDVFFIEGPDATFKELQSSGGNMLGCASPS